MAGPIYGHRDGVGQLPSECRPWPRYGGRASYTPKSGRPTRHLLAPLQVAVGTHHNERVGQCCLPPSTGWLTAYFIPQVMFSTLFCGVLVAAACYILTEFAAPVAAQRTRGHSPPGQFALESSAGPWWCGCSAPGVPLLRYRLAGIALRWCCRELHVRHRKFAYSVLIVSSAQRSAGSFDMDHVVADSMRRYPSGARCAQACRAGSRGIW